MWAAGAAEALWDIDPPASYVPRIVAVLKDPDSSARAYAAYALGRMSNAESAGSALAIALADSDGQVRSMAASALLGKNSSTAYAAPLAVLLSDKYPDARASSVHTLGEIAPYAEAKIPTMRQEESAHELVVWQKVQTRLLALRDKDAYSSASLAMARRNVGHLVNALQQAQRTQTQKSEQSLP